MISCGNLRLVLFGINAVLIQTSAFYQEFVIHSFKKAFDTILNYKVDD